MVQQIISMSKKYKQLENSTIPGGMILDEMRDIEQQVMRDFKITRKEGEWYHAVVTDSYGKVYDNYFEHAHEANKWIYYIWEKEDWFNSVNSQELLANAVAELARIDEENNIRKIM